MPPAYEFPTTNLWVKEQLADLPTGRSLFQIAANFYAEILSATAEGGFRCERACRASGAFGAITRKWRSGLKQAITMDIIRQIKPDLSRERIRSLQQEIFGQGQSSKNLHVYAIRSNSGRGRPEPMPEIPITLKESALKTFLEREHGMKDAVHAFFDSQNRPLS